jgi:phosphoglucomutase
MGLKAQKWEVKILDIHGRIVLRQSGTELQGNTLNLNIETLDQGIYQVRVEYQDGSFSGENLVKR